MTRRGFTLIELMAVLVIFALLFALAIPSFQLQSSRVLQDESRRLAGSLEFARQRAVMTGTPHRVWLDLDRSEYRIESFGVEPTPDDGTSAPAPVPAAGALSTEEELATLSLSPPPEPEREFHPLIGSLGELTDIDARAHLASFETADGAVDGGQAYIAFDQNGSSDWAAVALDNDKGERIVLHVEPLADAVWIEHVER